MLYFEALVLLIAIGSTEVHSARILCVFPMPSISHQFFFQPIWRDLSLHGHEVVVVTPNPLNDTALVNLTEIDTSFSYEIIRRVSAEAPMIDPSGLFAPFKITHSNLEFFHYIEKTYLEEVPQLRDIIKNKNETFDLIIIEGFFPILFGLSYRFNAPLIVAYSVEPYTIALDDLGIPTHSTFYPDPLFTFNGKWSLEERIKSVIFEYWERLWFQYYFVPRADKVAGTYFGEGIPYLRTLMKNASLAFVNNNLVLRSPRAKAPGYIEFNQMHITPPKPLPSDLKEFMDEAREGVIYFSLGTNVQTSNLHSTLIKTMMEAFAEVPYKVLWKTETDLPNKPKNVITSKWFPQQDILAHPNVKAFITQGGMQSLEETISRGVPIIGMPFFCDQFLNVHRMVEKGLGLSVEHSTVTKNQLKEAIIEVAENQKYRRKIEDMHQLLLDEPMNSTEKIIWWTEYVLRHKGALHLKSSAVDASLIDYYLLDVFAVLLVIPVVVGFLIFCFINKK